MQPLVPLVFHNLPSLYPPSFRRNDFLYLFNDHLNDVGEISPDFISVGVSGMNDCDLLSCGRPYGGCSIFYRKSLSTCVSPLNSCSDRFCGVRLCDSSGLSYLLVCVYMPTCYRPDSYNVYLNTLGELEGFKLVISILLLVISMWTSIVVACLLNYWRTLWWR